MADLIGADAFAEDAVAAPVVARRLLGPDTGTGGSAEPAIEAATS